MASTTLGGECGLVWWRSMQEGNSGGLQRPDLLAVVARSGDGTAMTSAGECTTWPHRACGDDRLVRLRPCECEPDMTGVAARDAEQRKAWNGDGCSGARKDSG
jgi:hypothetical protein